MLGRVQARLAAARASRNPFEIEQTTNSVIFRFSKQGKYELALVELLRSILSIIAIDPDSHTVPGLVAKGEQLFSHLGDAPISDELRQAFTPLAHLFPNNADRLRAQLAVFEDEDESSTSAPLSVEITDAKRHMTEMLHKCLNAADVIDELNELLPSDEVGFLVLKMWTRGKLMYDDDLCAEIIEALRDIMPDCVCIDFMRNFSMHKLEKWKDYLMWDEQLYYALRELARERYM